MFPCVRSGVHVLVPVKGGHQVAGRYCLCLQGSSLGPRERRPCILSTGPLIPSGIMVWIPRKEARNPADEFYIAQVGAIHMVPRWAPDARFSTLAMYARGDSTCVPLCVVSSSVVRAYIVCLGGGSLGAKPVTLNLSCESAQRLSVEGQRSGDGGSSEPHNQHQP